VVPASHVGQRPGGHGPQRRNSDSCGVARIWARLPLAGGNCASELSITLLPQRGYKRRCAFEKIGKSVCIGRRYAIIYQKKRLRRCFDDRETDGRKRDPGLSASLTEGEIGHPACPWAPRRWRTPWGKLMKHNPAVPVDRPRPRRSLLRPRLDADLLAHHLFATASQQDLKDSVSGAPDPRSPCTANPRRGDHHGPMGPGHRNAVGLAMRRSTWPRSSIRRL
jgi:hypothetical protein